MMVKRRELKKKEKRVKKEEPLTIRSSDGGAKRKLKKEMRSIWIQT